MSTQYRNIFFYYRGPTHGDPEGAADARQIEDNTTKALINTLELSSADLVRSFLDAVAINITDEGRDFEFFLQGGPTLDDAPLRRLVVVTAGDNAATATWSESAALKGRIDAAIHLPHRLFVAIEAKVGAILDLGQLDQHADDWCITKRQETGVIPAAWIFTTWAELHRWARRQLGVEHEPVTTLLLRQFAEYLEIIGVTSFSGFRRDDFELLKARRAIVAAANALGAKPAPADLMEAHLIKDRVSKLWDAILPLLTTAERMALGRIHVGSLRAQDSRIWAQTNADQPGVNFTFELDPEQLEVDLVAWKGDQVQLLDRWLDQPRSRAQLAALDSFELVIWRRRAIASQAGKPYWMHNTYEELERIPLPPPSDLGERLASHHDSCEPRWELIAYHLRRAWSRENVLAAGDDLARDVARSLQSAIPLLHEINWQQRLPIRATETLTIAPWRLRDYGTTLAEDSDPDPTEWRVIVEGPAVMVTSPSGMHGRGIRYFAAVWAGPGPDQAVFVAFTLTKGYALGGRNGHVTLLYYGPEIREAVRTINADLRSWEQGEHFEPEFQTAAHRPLGEAEVIRALRRGDRVEGPDWSELDALAQRRYGGAPPTGSWAAPSDPCVMSYTRVVD
jgi:hypothetical protein